MVPPLPTDPGRRLGERITLGDVFVAWRVDEIVPGRLRDRARPPEIARLLDISVSGAAVVGPAGDLRKGMVVAMRLGDADAVVRIRRITEFGEDDWRIYGVEFVETDLAFRDWINELLGRRRAPAEELGWESARD